MTPYYYVLFFMSILSYYSVPEVYVTVLLYRLVMRRPQPQEICIPISQYAIPDFRKLNPDYTLVQS